MRTTATTVERAGLTARQAGAIARAVSLLVPAATCRVWKVCRSGRPDGFRVEVEAGPAGPRGPEAACVLIAFRDGREVR